MKCHAEMVSAMLLLWIILCTLLLFALSNTEPLWHWFMQVKLSFSLGRSCTWLHLVPWTYKKIHWSCLFHKMFGWLGSSTPLDLYNYSFIKIGQFKSNRDWYQIRNKGISGTSFTFQINQGFCKGALRFGVFVFLLHLTMFLYTTLSGVNQLDQLIINYTKPFYSNWKTLCYYNSLR